MSIQIFLISWNKSVDEFMLFFLACSFLFIKSHKFSIILRSGDWAGQVSDGIWFDFVGDSRSCAVDWGIIVLKNIPPLRKILSNNWPKMIF